MLDQVTNSEPSEALVSLSRNRNTQEISLIELRERLSNLLPGRSLLIEGFDSDANTPVVIKLSCEILPESPNYVQSELYVDHPEGLKFSHVYSFNPVWTGQFLRYIPDRKKINLISLASDKKPAVSSAVETPPVTKIKKLDPAQAAGCFSSMLAAVFISTASLQNTPIAQFREPEVSTISSVN